MYAGSPYGQLLTAVYLPGARHALILGNPKELVEVGADRLQLAQFDQIARDHGALENSKGWMTPPACGEMAYSDAGTIIMRDAYVSGRTRYRPNPGNWEWGPLDRPGRRPFEEIAAETFGMYDAHSQRDQSALDGIAAWLGEDISGYLAANSGTRSARRDEERRYGQEPWRRMGGGAGRPYQR